VASFTGWFSAFREPGGSSQSGGRRGSDHDEVPAGVLGGQQPPSGCHIYLQAVFLKRVDSHNGRAVFDS
jgi:hypothetical protein